MANIPADLVYLMGCRKFEQFCCTLRGLLLPERFCPFCAVELKRRGRHPIVERHDWKLLGNDFPSPDVDTMLLIVPSRHVRSLEELYANDWEAVGELLAYSSQYLGFTGGGVVMRFGDPHLHAGTIPHLHINVIKPVCGQEFRTPLAKTVEKHEQDYARLLDFRMQLAERGGRTWLFSAPGIRETQP